MSINWVMLHPTTHFTPLPAETTLYTSPQRTAFSLSSPHRFPAHASPDPVALSSPSGTLFLTNRRIIYLPATSHTSTSKSSFQSFAAPLQNLADTHLTAPWFGPNVWVAAVLPVVGGGLDGALLQEQGARNGLGHAALELKITFKDGGAYDFHNMLMRLKERVAQEAESRSAPQGEGVRWENVHLDELPAYEEVGGTAPVSGARTLTTSAPVPSDVAMPAPQPPRRPAESGAGFAEIGSAASNTSRAPAPDEAPPGYEEAAATSTDSLSGLAARLERVASDEDARRR